MTEAQGGDSIKSPVWIPREACEMLARNHRRANELRAAIEFGNARRVSWTEMRPLEERKA